MLCFKDMTFCSCETCANASCERNWRLRDNSDYEQWSKNFSEGGLVAFTNFMPECESYQELEHA